MKSRTDDAGCREGESGEDTMGASAGKGVDASLADDWLWQIFDGGGAHGRRSTTEMVQAAGS